MPNTVSSVDLSQAAANSPALSQNFSIASLVSTIFSYAIPIAGAILLLLLLFGGFTYLTAAGNDEQVAKAKKIITQAIIGIVIVAFSFGIGLWIINTLGINSNTSPSPTTQIANVGAGNVKSVTATPVGKNGPGHATGIYNSMATVTPNTQIAQSITGNSVPSQGGTVIYGNSVESNNNSNNGLKGNTKTGTSYNGSGDSITGNSVPSSGPAQNKVNNSNNQTIGNGGTIGDTYSTNNSDGGITETGTAQVKKCAWYKKALNYFGLAKCPDQTSPNQTVTNNGDTTGTANSGDQATDKLPSPVTINGGQTAPIVTGYTYNIVVTTEDNTICTATNSLTNDTIISATIDASGSCQVKFLDSFKPASGTVTINTLDAKTNRPLSGVNINVQGQQAASSTSAGDANTQYLKGATSSSGTTIFTIDQAGSRMTTASLNGYISCNKNLLLTSGAAVVIYMDKVTNNTSSCKTETFLLTTSNSDSPIPTPQSNNSSNGMPAGKSNPSLPQPAGTSAGDIYQNLPQPAGNNSNYSTNSQGNFTQPSNVNTSGDPDMTGWTDQRKANYYSDKAKTKPREMP